MIATHLGVVDEEQINNMSYIFFEDVLTELGHKLNYEGIVNFAGNSFVEKSWDLIQESNPMLLNEDGSRNGSRGSQKQLADFLGSARVATPADLEKFNNLRNKGAATNEKA